jgi:hypothetical protein
MKTKQQSANQRIVTLGLLVAAAIVLMTCVKDVRAQQWSTASNGSDIYKTNAAGNVGIGTTTPLGRMQVVTTNDDNASVFAWDGRHFVVGAQGNGGGIVLSYNQTNGYGVISALSPGLAWRNIAIAPNAGNVGIGTTSPGALLDLASTTQLSNRLLLSGQEYFAGGNSSTSGVTLRIGVNRSGERQLWFADSAQAINATNAQLRMRFFSGSTSLDALSTNGTNALPLVLQSVGGNVGIGTITPGEKLEVSGNLKVTGTGNIDASGTITAFNIVAKYQDVAEWVESSQTLPAGTVVVLDQTKSNQVVASSLPYDTRVAGVISEQPGIALGESGENKVLVATTGRVRVNVDATKGTIHIGDLMVTSDLPGVAMKSEPIKVGGRLMHMPGTLIGKALEPLEKGSAKILVLLSLQ